jgi:hypothetical protein
MVIKKGDYIIGTEIWLVTKKSLRGVNFVYDLVALTDEPETMEVFNWVSGMYEEYTTGSFIKSVPRNFLRHLGILVPKEKAGYAIEVLFGQNKR